MPFQYPDHPNKNRLDPTRNESVENPFSEPEADANAPEIAENPFAPTLANDPVPYQPRDFQTMYSHRGGLIVTLGILGLSMWTLAAIGLTTSMFTRQSISESLFPLSTALILFGLPMSWSAWIMGRHDLAAMEAGAMRAEDGRRSTRIGCRAGLRGTVGGVGALGALVVLTVVSLIQGG